MGKMKVKEIKKHKTTVLRDIIGTDLLTQREKWIQKEVI